MDSDDLSGSTDIHQWIKRVQDNSERNAEQLYASTKNSSILKKAERERVSDDDIDLEYLKRKYLNPDTNSTKEAPQPKHNSPHLSHHSNHPTNSPRQPKLQHSPSAPPPRTNDSPRQTKLQHSPSKTNSSHPPAPPPQKKNLVDVYNNPYTKFGPPPPDLEEFAHFGISHPDLEMHARVAQNVHDMELMDFDHQPSESEWRRRFPNEKTEADKGRHSKIPHEEEIRAVPKDHHKSSPRREVRIANEVVTHRKEARLKDKPQPRKEPPRTNEDDSKLSLIANFDPLAIEAHSILTDWVSGKSPLQEDEAKSVPVSRWQQLRAGIHDLEKPSMLLPQPADPHTLSHHTASSKKKIVSDIKEEIKRVNKAPLPVHDPRPKMEARHEQVARMQHQREEAKKEVERKKQAEEAKRNEALAQEEKKRQIEKQRHERSAKEIEDEMLMIKLKREEEAKLIKEEEHKILEAHKAEVQHQVRVEREKRELDEARRIEEIRKEESNKQRNLKKNQYFELAKSHADKKLLQKCLSTWFFHVRELKLKLEKFKVVCDWKKVNQAFKTWRRFAQNSKAEREANDFAARAKVEQRNLDRAILFRDHKVILRCFLIWYSRAKLKGEERQIQEQHDKRRQQMAQFLEKAKQQPTPEPPAKPQNSPTTAKLKLAGAKKPAPQKGSPNPKLVDNSSPKPKLGPNSPRNAKPAASSPNSASKPTKAELANNPDLAQQLDTEDSNAIKNYIAPDGNKLYQEMESRAEQRKNRRKELEDKYKEAQRQKEEKQKQEAENERLRIEAEKQAKIEQKRLAKQKEAANQRRKEIEERSEKLAIAHDSKRIQKFHGFLPWRKYMAMQQTRLEEAGEHYERGLVAQFTRAWHQVAQHQIAEKLKFADEFYQDVLLERSWNCWSKALQTIQANTKQADAYCAYRLTSQHFVVWYKKALVAMEKRALVELQKELEMEEFYKAAIVKKMWKCWKRYVIVTKEERKSEKRKDDLRTKAQGWLQQYRQAKSSPSL